MSKYNVVGLVDPILMICIFSHLLHSWELVAVIVRDSGNFVNFVKGEAIGRLTVLAFKVVGRRKCIRGRAAETLNILDCEMKSQVSKCELDFYLPFITYG